MTTQSINGWIDKPLEGFYAHIYSNGHSVKNLFETEEDRIFGMNLLPIAAHACDVSLLMIQVMGTHFHEIVRGRPEDCERMRRFIKRQLETWMKKTGRNEYIPKGIDISIDGIETETELKNKIIYVYRNSIAAGFPQAPWRYRWGPGDILFRGSQRDRKLWDLYRKPQCKAAQGYVQYKSPASIRLEIR